MNIETVNIILSEGAQKPFYATKASAGADLRAYIKGDITLNPGERIAIPTGIFIELPEGSEAQIRPRSGLSLKEGIVAILGTIDADYQGEVGIIISNISTTPYIIKNGDRLAQMVMNGSSGLFQAHWNEVTSFNRISERGTGGFGHTGKN